MKCSFLFLLLSVSAVAQFTTVTGTVTDPNNLPYAFGTIASAIVSPAGTPLFISNSQPYIQPPAASGLDGTGKFIVRLADNTQLTPAGSTWTFTVCSASGTVQPSFGKGPICFTVTGITISGASQDIGATLTAAAPALTANFGPGGGGLTGGGTSGKVAGWVTATSLGNTPVFYQNTTVPNVGIFGSSIGSPLGSAGAFQLMSLSGAACGIGAGPVGIPAPSPVCWGQQIQSGGSSNSTTSGWTGLWVIGGAQGLAATNTSYTNAATFQANTTGTTSQEVRAVEIDAQPGGAGVAISRGLVATAKNGGTGTNTNSIQQAIYAQTQVQSGTTTNDYAVYIDSPNVISGIYTHHYGLYIADQTLSGGGTNLDPWSLYVAAGKSYFGGGIQQGPAALGVNCGTSSTCTALAAPLSRFIYGSVALVSGTPSVVTVTGFNPAFTSSTSFVCTVSNTTTQANPVKVVNASSSSITITGPATVTDVVNYVCVGT